ncbi:MAG: hypothetical protein NT013_00210 [Planctomycetia bacterium]|nr:hypothetical protein [Planctomycetia bacterium]
MNLKSQWLKKLLNKKVGHRAKVRHMGQHRTVRSNYPDVFQRFRVAMFRQKRASRIARLDVLAAGSALMSRLVCRMPLGNR